MAFQQYQGANCYALDKKESVVLPGLREDKWWLQEAPMYIQIALDPELEVLNLHLSKIGIVSKKTIPIPQNYCQIC